MHIELIETFLPMQHFVNEQIAEAGGVAMVCPSSDVFGMYEINVCLDNL